MSRKIRITGQAETAGVCRVFISEEPSGEKDSPDGLCESQENSNIFSMVIWATAL
jgi:hypothetical protein